MKIIPKNESLKTEWGLSGRPIPWTISTQGFSPHEYSVFFENYRRAINEAGSYLMQYLANLQLPHGIRGETKVGYDKFTIVTPISWSRLFEWQRRLGVVSFPHFDINTNYGNSQLEMRPGKNARDISILTVGSGLVDEIAEATTEQLKKTLDACDYKKKDYRGTPEHQLGLSVDTELIFNYLRCGEQHRLVVSV